MSYQWPVDAEDLFGERYPQMVNTGFPASRVDAVRAAITEMWPDAPGGWVYEWSELAARYAARVASPRRAGLRVGEVPDAGRRRQAAGVAAPARAVPARLTGFRGRTSSAAYWRCLRGGTTPVPVQSLVRARPPGAARRCCSPAAAWTAGRWTCTAVRRGRR